MKTTLDLPDEIVREMKLRALMQGRTLRDLVTELLRQGLGLSAPKPPPELPPDSPIQINENGFPVIRCGANAPAQFMSAEELIALEQSTLYEEDMQRAGLPH